MNTHNQIELNEAMIRPDHLRKDQMVAFLDDIARLLTYKDTFVTVSCPACGSKRFQIAFCKYNLEFTECANCKTVFMNPRPTPEILEKYYRTSKNYWYWNKYIFPASEDARREKIFIPRVEKILEICKRYHNHTGTLLEVGAGFGTFCEEMKKKAVFQQIIAVEPTPDLAETCRKKGIDVIQLPVEKVQLDKESVDVVVSFEVIEHLFNPGEFIRSCTSLLAPRGLLILSCPNIQGFDILVLREISDSIDVEHLNYFTPESLSSLIMSLGFEILETSTPGKLDAELVRKKVLSGEFNIEDQPFLKKILITNWVKTGTAFQTFLATNNLSSHLWIVGRKK